MKCKECFDFLDSYIAGELPVDEKMAFDRHLDKCPPCVVYVQTYKQTIALSQCACRDKAAPDLPEAMVKAILGARRTANVSTGGEGHQH